MGNAIKLRGLNYGAVKHPQRILLHKDGSHVKVGDTVTSGKGQEATVTGWPNTGHNRVWVKWNDGEMGTEYFPNVFDLTWQDEA